MLKYAKKNVKSIVQVFGDFCTVVLWDAICYPVRYVNNLKLKYKTPCACDSVSCTGGGLREPVRTKNMYVCIHEWGGYKQSRKKSIKNIKPFTCGLEYQLKRFKAYKGDYDLEIILTMSDPKLCDFKDDLKNKVDNFVEVDNLGMDFSGYNASYQMIKDKDNSYVILTNSSVNSLQTDFIDSYINYMNNNLDVGLLGVSYSSMYAHTLIRNNFNPHIQSFFIMTTISVLKQIVTFNKNQFPGIKERNKHMLIRNGEVLISRIALELGYNLAVVTESGVSKFNYRDFPLRLGEYRWYTQYPNAIFPITMND